jgi:transcriptional regulator with XRE-family HTH domain
MRSHNLTGAVMHFDAFMHHVDTGRQSEVLQAVRRRMERERITQRELANQLGISQGHLSKVLRGQTERATRVLSALAAWADPDGVSDETAFLAAARSAVQGQPQGFHLLMRLMHLVRQLRDPPRRNRKTSG